MGVAIQPLSESIVVKRVFLILPVGNAMPLIGSQLKYVHLKLFL